MSSSCKRDRFSYVWTEGDQWPRIGFAYAGPDPATEGLSFTLVLERADATILEVPATVTTGSKTADIVFHWQPTDLVPGRAQSGHIRVDGSSGSQTIREFAIDVADRPVVA